MFDDPKFLAKLDGLERRHAELTDSLGRAEVISNRAEFLKLSKEHSSLSELTEQIGRRRKAAAELEDTRGMLRDGDPELRELAKAEMAPLEAALADAEQRIKVLLLPRDPLDDKNILVEIRSGTGGEEAALFAAELFRMYMRYAERQRWRVEILSRSDSSGGGIKEVIGSIEGKEVYSRLKYESGVHRVQRVPATEAQGRIHTSACTVAILPELDEVEAVDVNPAELRVDTFRASGAGGQHVNKTDSAIRITHLPSGIVVSCQAERSQHNNRSKAMKMLMARLYEMEQDKQRKDMERFYGQKGEIAWGSQIRSYVLQPYTMVKDHRSGVETSNVQAVLDGALDPFVEAYLKQAKREETQRNA